MEIYKDIKGYEGLYKVSNLGNVKSFQRGKEIILKLNPDNKGYLCVGLYNNDGHKTKRPHYLVAEAFLNHNANGHKMVVNHKNFIRTDSRLENLEIITQRENANQKHLKSSSKYVGVTWKKSQDVWVARIWKKGESKYLGHFANELDAHNAYQNELNEQ